MIFLIVSTLSTLFWMATAIWFYKRSVYYERIACEQLKRADFFYEQHVGLVRQLDSGLEVRDE